MENRKFFEIISAITSFGSAVILLIGALKLSPELMATMSEGWAINKVVLENIATQKADFVSGFWLIVIAFSVQLLALLVNIPHPFFANTSKGKIASTVIGCSIVALFVFVDNWLSHRYVEDTKKAAAKSYITSISRQDNVGTGDLEQIRQVGELLLGLKKGVDETDRDFARIVAEKLGITVPPRL